MSQILKNTYKKNPLWNLAFRSSHFRSACATPSHVTFNTQNQKFYIYTKTTTMKRTRYENSNTTTMGPDSLQSIKPVTPDSITEVVLQPNNNGSKDPFRQFYLEQVQTIIEKKECSASNLLELLKMSTPNITMERVINNVNNDREKSLKILRLRIHPDKHPHAPIIATKLFQDVQGFYDKCCEKLHVTNGDGGKYPVEVARGVKEVYCSLWELLEGSCPQ